jgi:hypothetical protein
MVLGICAIVIVWLFAVVVGIRLNSLKDELTRVKDELLQMGNEVWGSRRDLDRFYKSLLERDREFGKVFDSLFQDDLDAANTRAALLKQMELINEAYEALYDDFGELWMNAAKSFECEARGGHKFECIEAYMEDEEPRFVFECSVCEFCYGVFESELSKKEERLAKKYIDSFKAKKGK